jgi:hypothetical protein
MKREQFLSRLRRWCRKNGLRVDVDTKQGKGSHYIVRVDGQKTIVQSGELTPKHVHTLLTQLGLPPDALE